MLLHQRFIPGLAISSYLVADEKSGEAVVIDPVRDVDDYLDFAERHQLKIRHILETHVHADFVSGSAELSQRLEGQVSIHCSGEGGAEWIPPYADPVVQDGDDFKIGSLRFVARHMPGHTPEHLCWELYDQTRSSDTPWLIFTGDFLFVGDVGRPDLLGEDERDALAHELYRSVFDRMKDWPDFAEIYPGHGGGSLCGKAIGSRQSSTVGYERQFNRSLQLAAEEEWVRALLANMPAAPPYFHEMKRVNRQGPSLLGNPRSIPKRLTPSTLDDLIGTDHCIVDVRAKESFAAAHIPSSINIPLASTLPNWAGWVLSYDVPMVLVADSAADIRNATCHLQRIGLDQLVGCLDSGLGDWQAQARAVASIELATPQELAGQLTTSGTKPTLLDVRTAAEFNGGHIDGAVHVPIGQLETRMDEFAKDAPIQIVCGSGYRGSIGASLLARAGFERLSNLLGGMTAWRSAGLAVVTSSSLAAKCPA